MNTATASASHLTTLQPGFADMAHDSQRVFRAVLGALSYPGVAHDVPTGGMGRPEAGRRAAQAILLSLLDAETTLWLSPKLAAGDAGAWLRFHTGCRLVADAAQADFAWVAMQDAVPELTTLRTGTDAAPEHAVTCVIDMPAFSTDLPHRVWQLSGPGIQGTQPCALPAQTPQRVQQVRDVHQAGHALFPRGVDMLLTSEDQVIGLPRTTQIAGA